MKFSKPLFIVLLVLLIVTLACGSTSDVSVESPSDVEEEDAPQIVEEVDEPEEEVVETEEEQNAEPVEETKEVGTARSNPAPVGSVVTADDMAFEILGSTRPADDIIMSGNMFNTEPEEGEEYILIEMKIECLKDSDDTCSISPFNFQMIGDEGITYDAEWFVSGVEGILESEEFYGGAVVSGLLPFIVQETDGDLIFVYDPLWGDKFYMSVQ